jgi:UDP-GlcNAc:undecaprenyl-phosphate GlcNAc-1-phosphate transferase
MGAMQAGDIAVPFLLAFAVSLGLTPLVGRLALRLSIIDRPSERSVSQRANIPLLGGLAVAGGAALGLGLCVAAGSAPVASRHLAGWALGALVVLGLGICDDRFGLGAGAKFAGQVVAALIAIAAGYQLGHVTEPVSRSTWFLSAPVAWLASLVWIVGVTNALNLIDGLDGLATGVGAIICATLAVTLWQAGQPFGVCAGVALLGGLLGFLPWNFPPARIFLGDTGSLFIGYSLALLALEGYRQVTVITFVVPLLALAVPILDTALSIVRRARTGQSPFRADRLHIHHRLLARRGSARSAVLQFYFLTACFSLIAVSFTELHGYVAALCLAAVGILTLRLLSNLGVFSLAPGEDRRVASPPAPREGTR